MEKLVCEMMDEELTISVEVNSWEIGNKDPSILETDERLISDTNNTLFAGCNTTWPTSNGVIPSSQRIYARIFRCAEDSKEVAAAVVLEWLAEGCVDMMLAIVILRIQTHDKEDCNTCQHAGSCKECMLIWPVLDFELKRTTFYRTSLNG